MNPIFHSVFAGLLLCVEAAEAATITTLAGTGAPGSSGDGGPALEARLNAPFGIVRGPDAAVWFCEYQGHTVRRIDSNGILSTVVGSTQADFTGDGGPARAGTLNHPHEIRFDRKGNLFIADTSNHAIRRVDAKTRTITTIAGTGKPGYSGDGGLATAAQLNLPISLQLNPQGDLYICDIGNHVIRRVDAKTGRISTFAGTGKSGAPTDGAPITGTPLNGPRSLDVDVSGDLWLATREGNQVWQLDVAGNRMRLVAGTGRKGLSGDGGPAKRATLSGPKGIAIGSDGVLYLADTDNHVVRLIDPKRGVIERYAGTGQRGAGGDGDALASTLAQPHALWVDPDGTLFISDSLNHRVRVLTVRR